MNKIVEALLIIISIILSGYSIYYVAFVLFAIKKHPQHQKYEPKHRFAIVIAARNEEMVIASLVNSLKKQNYPKELFDIYVVPNNCIDDTKEKALEAGAKILECQYPVSSKGEVLGHSFNQLMSIEYDYDAFCVFDADNIVDQNFLTEMNNALCDGSRLAQGYRETKNPYDTWITGSYNVYFTVVNRFINHAKYNANMSAYISGTGFMVSVDVLKKSGGWRTSTLSEDTEFTLACIINGEKIDWVPEAITYDEQPLTLKQSLVQRKRWSSGAMQLLSLYYKKIFERTTSKNFIQNLDCIMSLLAIYIQILSIVQLLLTMFATMLLPTISLMNVLTPLIISYISTVVLAVAVLALDHKLNHHCIKGILTFWLFIMSWTPINIISLFKKTTQWYEIKHTGNMKTDKYKVSHQDI